MTSNNKQHYHILGKPVLVNGYFATLFSALVVKLTFLRPKAIPYIGLVTLLSFHSASTQAQDSADEFVPTSSIKLTKPTESTNTKSASELDWVTQTELTAQQQAQVPNNCCGLYLEPLFPAPTTSPENTDVSANAVHYDDNGIITYTGSVQALQGEVFISADSGVYNTNTDLFTLNKNIQIRQPGMLIVGATAIIDRPQQIKQIDNASYVFHAAGTRGTAQMIIYTDADGIVTIDNGIYTRCEPGDDSWVMAAKSIVLNQNENHGVARNVTLRINNIPIFYSPYLRFPLNDQRTSGFLAPSFGSSKDGGFEFSTPYYFNLAPHYDATFTPRFITDRGTMIGLEGRYRGQHWSNIVNLNYLPKDKQYDLNTNEILESNSPTSEERWSLDYDFSASFGNNWSAIADYSAISDPDFFQDFGNAGLYDSAMSYLTRYAQISYLGKNWSFNTRTINLQIVDPNVPEQSLPYNILPSFNVNADFINDFGMEYGINTELSYFDRSLSSSALNQTQIEQGVMVTGQRLAIEPTVSWPWSTAGTFLTPTLKYKYASYHLQDQTIASTDSPSRGIFTGSLDGGLIFDRNIKLNSQAYTQTLEPRLYYLYSEYEDQSDIPIFDSADMTFSFNQLFRDNRFSGKDRIGDSNQLTLAISSRFLDTSGREKAHVSIGQIMYFKDRRVSLLEGLLQTETARSAIVSDFSYHFNTNWRVSSYLEWDPNKSSMAAGNFQFRYQSDINHIINFSYRYRDELNPINSAGIDTRTDQTDISTLFPLNTNWGLIARWNYDLANARNLESIVGLEYNTCCWAIQLIAREWLDSDNLLLGKTEKDRGIFFQFELKGLGGVLGGSVSRILGNAILGYKEHEYSN